MPTPTVARLRPVLSLRFLKYALVGGSGVAVNLVVFRALHELGVQANLAAALAIELSVLSNFFVNAHWTFADRDRGGSMLRSAGRYHLVSLVGAAIQLLVFVVGNVLWLALAGDPGAVAEYFGAIEPTSVRGMTKPFSDPPRIATWMMHVSQLVGIGAATVWNFLGNFHFTFPGAPEDRRG